MLGEVGDEDLEHYGEAEEESPEQVGGRGGHRDPLCPWARRRAAQEAGALMRLKLMALVCGPLWLQKEKENAEKRRALYDIMSCMRDIRKRTERTDMMFEPLKVGGHAMSHRIIPQI